MIEVLIAAGLTALLMAAVYASFFTVALAGKGAADRAEAHVEAAMALEALSSELRSTFFKRSDPFSAFAGAKKGLASELSFTAASYPAAGGGDIVGIRYSVAGENGRRSLKKEYWSPVTGARMEFEAVDEIDGFDIWYFTGTDWVSAWDGRLEGRAPRAVSAVLRLKGGQELTTGAIPARTQ